MLIDMHIHTARYSPCSILDPYDLVRKASELGLSGITITEHYCLWSENEIEALKRETGSELKIFRGQEVTSSVGHLLVLGYYKKLQEYLPLDEVLSKVHDEGGLVILAHPFRYGNLIGHHLEKLKNKFDCFDGIEALNGNQIANENEYGMKVWKDLGMTGLGGSDAHSVGMLGTYATKFLNPVENEVDLIREIKEGRCEPVCLNSL